MVDAYESMVEHSQRRVTDDFGSPPTDHMMSPPLEPLETSFDANGRVRIDPLNLDTDQYRLMSES